MSAPPAHRVPSFRVRVRIAVSLAGGTKRKASRRMSMSLPTFHDVTPTFESDPLSALVGMRVFLKMDAHQQAGSFKVRGMSRLCAKLVRERGVQTLVSSSGGNAGFAVAFVGKRLGVKVRVFVPTSTSERAIRAIESQGATVSVAGAVWDEAHAAAVVYANEHEHAAVVHPFDDEDIWIGNASLVQECRTQMAETVPDAILLSVGGGGLMCGVLHGLHSDENTAWRDVPLIAAETVGAASFATAVEQNEHIMLPAITSVATSLGARKVCSKAFEWRENHKILPVKVSDAEAIAACNAIALHHRCLVEPACGAAIAALMRVKELLPNVNQETKVLVIVCGGIGSKPFSDEDAGEAHLLWNQTKQ